MIFKPDSGCIVESSLQPEFKESSFLNFFKCNFDGSQLSDTPLLKTVASSCVVQVSGDCVACFQVITKPVLLASLLSAAVAVPGLHSSDN